MNVNVDKTPATIAAIVVLYHPDAALLERLLDSLKREVSKVFVVDNTPVDEVAWLSSEWFVTKKYEVNYYPLGDNYGIAKAQNVGIDLALRQGCSHVVLFDQDSVIPVNMINELLQAEKHLSSNGCKVASVGPIFLDEKTGEYANIIRHGRFLINRIKVSPSDVTPVQADYLIASGSLISAPVLQIVGLMREDLFIDWVDIEWGLRAGCFGFSHYAIPRASMRHSIGDDFVRVGKYNINLHNDIRNYYIVRNACYLLLASEVNIRWRMNIVSKIPLWLVLYTITSKNKIKSFKLLLKACFDGFNGRLGKAF